MLMPTAVVAVSGAVVVVAVEASSLGSDAVSSGREGTVDVVRDGGGAEEGTLMVESP